MTAPGQAADATLDAAFARLRDELAIRDAFPPDVLEEAERTAARVPAAGAGRADATDVPFVTVDPPGSRDLDQAVHAERDGDGWRLRYAIADVGFWVDRGGAVEREAWLRGVTFYAPDRRETLYPPALSEGAASLLPDAPRPAVLFDVRLDARAEPTAWSVGRALVRSRAQLTYAELQAGDPRIPTLGALAEIGPLRLAREAERGGVSLPAREQQVQRRAAAALGYALEFEAPTDAEEWNAQVSLLTGHLAALRMLDARVGVLRTMPRFDPRDVAKLRRVALTLGFDWPEGTDYPDFLRRVPRDHPRLDVLVRQAQRTMRGADYVAFDGAPPEQPLHGALAFAYAHVTAPLRRLADRYVLDLLLTLAEGARPSPAEVATLRSLAPVMHAAGRAEGTLARRAVDVAEAWTLRGRAGDTLAAVVVDVRRAEAEVQVEDPPVRAEVSLVPRAEPPPLGARVPLRVERGDVAAGRVRLAFAGPPAAGPP
ncbi:RNB domain-containing ribonuclease [Roseisolibacter sp. H3M3-2]|uniref:RNB domain-containing ribonuclease n=1 Tax=Roseisolibacter sp. H3M3-2 TaxID=3031323 RepID=UPI0023DCC322|nr:RNB domain-containing ribonuclease [Roseisolibacter sp. H3M3-2]MDF1502964.1 RNB domain-containing ribonuclease [Roseisolibacter sp. H3M3-2]